MRLQCKGRYIIDHTHINRLVTPTRWRTWHRWSKLDDLEGTLAVQQLTMFTGDQPSDDNWYTSRSLLLTQDKLYLVRSSILLFASAPIS